MPVSVITATGTETFRCTANRLVSLTNTSSSSIVTHADVVLFGNWIALTETNALDAYQTLLCFSHWSPRLVASLAVFQAHLQLPAFTRMIVPAVRARMALFRTRVRPPMPSVTLNVQVLRILSPTIRVESVSGLLRSWLQLCQRGPFIELPPIIEAPGTLPERYEARVHYLQMAPLSRSHHEHRVDPPISDYLRLISETLQRRLEHPGADDLRKRATASDILHAQHHIGVLAGYIRTRLALWPVPPPSAIYKRTF